MKEIRRLVGYSDEGGMMVTVNSKDCFKEILTLLHHVLDVRT